MPRTAPSVTPQQALAIARLWDSAAHAGSHLRTGENSVWSFEGERSFVLRVTSEAHRSHDQLQSELHFVEFLVARGVAAARPLQSLAGGNVVNVSGILGSSAPTYAAAFERLDGRHFEFYSNDIDRPLFTEWGRAMGVLHNHAAAYLAPPSPRRPDWHRDEVAGCPVPGIGADGRTIEIRNELVGWLQSIPRHPNHYGMVHGDFERTNFVLNGGTIRLFDFDDCCYHWFCWDIACALWAFRNAPEQARTTFLGWFVEGYASIREPDTALLARFSDLIRLRTLGLLLYRARDRADPPKEDWLQRTRAWLDSSWAW